jgi:hypothetical protein
VDDSESVKGAVAGEEYEYVPDDPEVVALELPVVPDPVVEEVETSNVPLEVTGLEVELDGDTYTELVW